MALASETTTPFAMAAPLVAFAILLLLTTMAVPLARYKVRRHQEREVRWALIEIVIVMTIVSILASIAVPLCQKSVIRAKESVLRNNLFTLRTVIDEYTFDKKKAPQSLEDLVQGATCARFRSTR